MIMNMSYTELQSILDVLRNTDKVLPLIFTEYNADKR
jgi:hypothetical protein